MDSTNLDRVANAALLIGKHRDEVLDTWFNLCKVDSRVSSADELPHLRRAFESLCDSLIRDIGRKEDASYFETAEMVAREVAYNDIPYKTVVRAYHLFEESYLSVLDSYVPPEDLLGTIGALDDLHHETIALLSQKYFELADDMILALVRLVALRDYETGGHLERTRDFADALSLYMGLPVDFRRNLRRVSPLHDIGKLGIPDSILRKPGRLDHDQFERMKLHTLLGAHVIEEIIGSQLVSRGHLILAREVARSHHERYDGTGYPDGLEGESIPLSARIFAVADVYDALVSERPYKAKLPHDTALNIIREGSGGQFDPAVVEALEGVHTAFQQISAKYSNRPIIPPELYEFVASE